MKTANLNLVMIRTFNLCWADKNCSEEEQVATTREVNGKTAELSFEQVDVSEITNSDSWKWACLFWSDSEICFTIIDWMGSVDTPAGVHFQDGPTRITCSWICSVWSGAVVVNYFGNGAELQSLCSAKPKQWIWVSRRSQSSEWLTDATQRQDRPEAPKHTTSVCVCVVEEGMVHVCLGSGSVYSNKLRNETEARPAQQFQPPVAAAFLACQRHSVPVR